MTIIKRYSENQELLAEDKPVDARNAEQYISQYGSEYAQGYVQAVADIEKQIKGILWKEIGSNYSIPNGTARIHTALKVFYSHKLELLKQFESLGIKQPPASQSPDLLQS